MACKTKACKGLKVKSKLVNPYSFGGVLSSTASGAATGGLTGAAAGGVGAIPGAIVGGAVGLMKGIFGHVAEKKAEEGQANLENQEIMNRKASQLAGFTSKDGKVYGPGGVEVNPMALNINASGGHLSTNRTHDPETDLIEFNQGGTHEQNPNGGIQVGMGENGKPNMFEEGEVILNVEGEDFGFSDRILFKNKGEFPPFMKDGTYATAIKDLKKAFKDRNSKYDNDTFRAIAKRAADKHELVKELQNNPGLHEDGKQNQFPLGGNYSINPEISGDYSQTDPTVNWDIYNQTAQKTTSNAFDINDPEAWEKEYGQYSDIGVLNQGENKPQSWLSDDTLARGALGLGALGSLSGVFSSMRAKNRLRTPEALKANLIDTSGIRENLVNRQDMLRNVAETQQSAIGALASRASGNFGAFAANVAGIQGKTAQATSTAMLQASELDSREKARVQQLKLGAQQFNRQSQNQVALANEQNMAAYEAQKAAYSQGIAANLGSLGQSLINYGIGTQAGKYGGLTEQVRALTA